MKSTSKLMQMVWVALLAAALAVLAQIIIPLGPVPFSMAMFGVYLAGALLQPAWAAACMGVYLALGVVGLPVFAGFKAGPQVLLGPTGGYLAGYFVIAVALALAVKYTPNYWLQFAAALAATAGCYLLGTLWFMVSTGSGFIASLALCVLPFAIPDIAKAALALLLAKALTARLKKERAAG